MTGIGNTLRIAVAQMSSQADLQHNLSRVRALVERAAAQGAQVVVLPENFAYLGPPKVRCAAAEALDEGGPIVSDLAHLAKAHRITIIGGAMPEKSADPERPYQTCIVVDADGSIVARYRKIHLFDAELREGERYCESATVTPGDSIVDVEIRGFRIGLSICYDVRFPELYQRLAERRADLMAVPSSFALTTGKDHWHVLLRARAIETQAYVAAAAQWGISGSRRTYGKSLIVDPWGDVVAQCSEGEGIAVATIDRAYLNGVRASLDFHAEESS